MARNGSKYRRRDASEWSALLAEQAASGQSQRAFCAAKGVAQLVLRGQASVGRWQ